MKKIVVLFLLIFALTSCAKSQDIINPEAEYRYFFWATCPHCQELNRLLESADVLSQISVEKREVYHNTENRQIFADLVAQLKPRSDGVPFVYDTVSWEVAVWVAPAFKLLTSRIESSPEETSMQEEKYPKWETILNPDADYILFYGDDDEDSLSIKDTLQEMKISLEIREVYSHSQNGAFFMTFAKRSGIATESLDVPFLYHKWSAKYAQWSEEIQKLVENPQLYSIPDEKEL